MHEIAVVGSGFIATQHGDAYAQIDDAEIVAVASLDENRDEYAEEYAPDAATYADLETMLDEVDPDVVDACTPTHVHREVVETAADRGYDVFCEKPIAPTLEDAHAIADVVEENDVTCMVGHAVRFSPAYARMKELVDSGEVGDPGVVRSSRISPFPDWGWENWFGDLEKSGGVFLDLVIHDFDFLRWVLGEVEEVFARSNRWRDGDDLMDHSVAVLTFADGTVAHVEGSWAQPETREFGYSLEVAGDDGLVEFDGDAIRPFELFTADEAVTQNPMDKGPMQAELEHFLECREEGRDPLVSVEEAIESARVSLAALESADRGEPVTVEEVVA